MLGKRLIKGEKHKSQVLIPLKTPSLISNTRPYQQI